MGRGLWAHPGGLCYFSVDVFSVASGVIFSARSFEFGFGFSSISLPKAAPLVLSDEEVWVMVVTLFLRPSVVVVVLDFEGGWLVVVFQYLWVVFHLVDCPQFYGVALKLDGLTHFPAGVNSTELVFARPCTDEVRLT